MKISILFVSLAAGILLGDISSDKLCLILSLILIITAGALFTRLRARFDIVILSMVFLAAGYLTIQARTGNNPHTRT